LQPLTTKNLTHVIHEKKNVLFAVLAVAVLFCSCTKQVTGPEGPAGPSYTGSITGFITLYDQYGVKLIGKNPSLKVSIDNTTKVCYADSIGLYSFAGLYTGSYTLSIADTAKSSPVFFGPSKVFNIALLTGQSNHDVKLAAIPGFNLTSAVAVDTALAALNYVKIRGLVSPDTKARELVIFVGSDSLVSSAPANYLLTYSTAINANASKFSTNIAVTDLYDAGFVSGSKVYIMLYSAAVGFASESEYEDLNTGKIVYNAIGTAPIWIKVTIP